MIRSAVIRTSVLRSVCLGGRRLASTAVPHPPSTAVPHPPVPAAFPISASLTIGDVRGRLRQVQDAEMRQKFEIDVTATVADAVLHLAFWRITFACVVDLEQGGRVVGAFTERDYLRYAVRADASSFFSGRDASSEPVTRAMSSAERMLSVRADTTVFASLAMVQQKIWRHVPVLNDSDRLAYVIDIRDLLIQVDGGRSDQPVGSEAGPGTALRGVWHGKLVADILRAKRQQKIVEGTTLELYLRTRAATHTISNTATIEEAARQMARERLTFLCVYERLTSPKTGLSVPSWCEKNRVVGLVNERDFVRFAAEHGGLAPHASTLVRTIMTPLDKVECVSITDTVSTCADVFFSRNVRHLPVIDGEHLFGVLSLRDILRPILEGSGPAALS
ncbi:hypothetical protein T492DRAFT_1147661 [Pavlovales sp. CCMP2436]|nr:hypothetical protein T492DRAFT_1147661 [Pavlovales sp. CCMP2436]